jgi:tetratricopeptide (TPR) repeat protein
MDPANPEIYNGRGNAYYKKGRYEEAIADYDRAIKLRPGYRDALRNRDIAYRRKANWRPLGG